MKRQMRTYYYAIFGAIGGLIGWQASNLLGLSFVSNLYAGEAIVGALVGLCMGLLIGISEGVLTRNIIQVLKSGAFSGALGAAAGAVGLPLSEFLFQKLGAGLAGRALAWSLFGLLLGLAQGVVGRSQAWKGMLGGLLGGGLGGILLELSQRHLANSLTGKMVGLVLLGASVAAFISLIVTLLSRAWLEVTSGKLKGSEFILDKFMRKGFPSIAIGSSALKSEIVLPDPDIAPQHAMLSGDGTHFSLKDMSLSGTFVNKRRIERVQLADRQTLRMGNTELVYHEKRGTMASTRISRISIFVCLLLVQFFAPQQPAQAQAEAAQVRITQVDATDFPQVVVYVSVTDADGKPLSVDPDLIRLDEGGQIVQAGQISGVGGFGPLTTLLVMDVSGSMNNGGKLAAARQAARAYVDQMRTGDQAGLISFNTAVQVVQGVTSDRQALIAAIDSLSAREDTAMFDALQKAIQVLEPVPGRKAIILLTDGLDNSSTSTSQEVIDSVGPGGLSISTIGLGDPAAGKSFFGINEASLRELAGQAGGAYAFTADSAALQSIYQAYGRGLQSEYAITYSSPSRLRDGVSRRLTASLGQPGQSAWAAAEYNPGGVLPEVTGTSPFLFIGTLIGLVFLLFVPTLIALLFRRKPVPHKSRVKLK